MSYREREFEAEFDRPATTKELAQRMGLPVETIDTLHYLNKQPVSLDTSTDESSEPLGNFIEDGDDEGIGKSVELQALRDHLDTLLGNLDEEDSTILRGISGYGAEEMTYTQIGKLLGMSAGAARHRKTKITNYLQGDNRTAHLLDFLR